MVVLTYKPLIIDSSYENKELTYEVFFFCCSSLIAMAPIANIMRKLATTWALSSSRRGTFEATNPNFGATYFMPPLFVCTA